MYIIYVLIDPRDYIPRYVGMTKNSHKRMDDHISGKGGNLAKSNWIMELTKNNTEPIMAVLENVHSQDEAREREAHWITYYQTFGISLFNHVCLPVENRTKIGRKLSMDETRKIILFRLAYKKWPEHVSAEMRLYYTKNYIRKDGKFYTKARQWLIAYREEGEPDISFALPMQTTEEA